MVVAYIVRCNFTEPAQEDAWNAWYSGPKIAQMLAKPHSARASAFAAQWAPAAITSRCGRSRRQKGWRRRRYRAQWGFREWEAYVTDWSRDLFDGGAATEMAFAVPRDGALHAVSFDGVDRDEAGAARSTLAASLPDMMWLSIIGLDRHTPLIGLRPLPDLAASRLPDRGASGKIQEAIYRPIITQRTS